MVLQLSMGSLAAGGWKGLLDVWEALAPTRLATTTGADAEAAI
jgi:hypothetical protein